MHSLLAKSDPPLTLRKHTYDVLRTSRGLLRHLPPRLRKRLKPFLKWLVFWHDLGKVQPAFQNEIYLKTKGFSPFLLYSQDLSAELPHALFSIAWISSPWLRKLSKKLARRCEGLSPEKARQILLSVIAYHHWRDSIHEAVAVPSLTALFYSQAQQVYPKLKHLLRAELGKIRLSVSVGWNDELTQGLAGEVSLRHYAPPPYLNEWLPERLGFSAEEAKQWILLAGALQWCDHYASAVEAGLPADLNKPLQVGLSKESLRNFLDGKKDAWQLELLERSENLSQCNHLVLVAPTGIGKTEFAFLWGAQAGRFIYTLPLRAAVHQTYERAKGYFGSDTVGLLHGDAALHLAQRKGDSELSPYESHELARHLAYAAVICTGDQLFPYAMRPPGYERIYFSALTGRLIIDEVQAYDPRAAALIIKLLEDIVSLGGSFLLITATLPPFIREEIENILNSQNGLGKASPGNANNPPSHQLQTTCPKWEIDYYDRLPDVCRHCVQIVYYSEEKLHQSASFVAKVEGIVNGEVKPPYPLDGRPVRILIVLNTVTQALQVYDVLKDRLNGKAEICLLHSLFTYNDRNKKEMDLKKAWGLGSETSERGPDRDNPQIVVATQVVEAALDIDADFLLTELAPADALVQRMGRVARRFRADDKGVKPPERPNVFIWVRQQNSNNEDKAESDSKKSKKKEVPFASGEGRIYDRELLELTLKQLTEGLKGLSKVSVGCQENPEAFCLPEKRKKEWVEGVYKALEESEKESSYLQAFYRTLEAVRAGFVAEHREEAQRVFRQLVTVPALPKLRCKDLKKAIEQLEEEFKVSE
ncbi:MAG: CRISPR-associated helicase Cas3', partial [Bacteroidia bacterium]|nr:CRISPR-associated helicase Cas3' [Bacteroidia bacterium]